ncbi:MAG: iron-sulfur cluster assembly protein [Spirochaetia bacterium]|nr:iron-sulfur cluster assembly protein [Spirochaetia bacterium]
MEKEDILKAVSSVIDPEVGVNIVDLGLIYEVNIKNSNSVDIKMTMTSRGCPMHQYLIDEVKKNIKKQFSDIEKIDVELVWDPPWTNEKMSLAAKKQLGWKNEK